LHLLFLFEKHKITTERYSGENAMLNTKVNTYTLTDITLPKYKIWTIEGNRRGDVISCLNGTLWVTQEGDLKDYIVESGRSFWVTRPGPVVVQALDNSKFKYSLNEMQNHIEDSKQSVQQTGQPKLSHPR
jgi:hypothetical protein